MGTQRYEDNVEMMAIQEEDKQILELNPWKDVVNSVTY